MRTSSVVASSANDPGDLASAKFKIEFRAVERAPAVLGDQHVAVPQSYLGADLAVVRDRLDVSRAFCRTRLEKFLLAERWIRGESFVYE